jgi:hypothetical protein
MKKKWRPDSDNQYDAGWQGTRITVTLKLGNCFLHGGGTPGPQPRHSLKAAARPTAPSSTAAAGRARSDGAARAAWIPGTGTSALTRVRLARPCTK